MSAATGAFGTWNAVSDAETPGVVAYEGTTDEVGYRPSADDNRNTVRYADKGHDLAGGALAVTVLTFADDGRIVDADVILNGGGSRKFGVLAETDADAAAAAGAGVDKTRYDVQNVLTHEVGHFLGLGEEQALLDATMFVTSARGETMKRDLSSDDELGVRSLYVPGTLAAAEEAAAAGSCSLAAGASSAVPGSLYALAGAMVAAAWARARTRRRRLGVGGAAVALLALVGPIGCGGAPDGHHDHDGTDAVATVIAASSRWEGGLIVTRLTVKTVECHGGDCPDEASLEVLGGSAEGLTQIVGHHAVPDVGASIALALRDGRARWLHGLAARHEQDRRPPAPTPDEERRAAPTTLPGKSKTADPRRAHERAPIHLGVRLVAEGAELVGTTENVSEGGMFVAVEELAQEAAQGAEIEVLLDVPGRDEPVRARGEVRWVRSAGEEQPAGVGIRFVELEGDDAAAIRDLVDQEELAG
jgi:uncharacterized protein (TIGR02266 family)